MISQSSRGDSSIRPGRVAIRTCIGCRATGPKNGLIRIVRSPRGVYVDLSGKQRGRGAYMHAQRSCWERALQGNQVEQALRMEIGPHDQQRLQVHADSIPDDEVYKVSQ